MKKSALFWEINFFLLLIILIIETILFLFCFFILPNDPISKFPSLMKLPAKYLFLFVLGGLGKTTFMGFYLHLSYCEWQRIKKNE